jgi:pimeloyl-ACP methyl ester carboxylesterase
MRPIRGKVLAVIMSDGPVNAAFTVADGGVRADAKAVAGFLNTDWNPRDLPAGVSTRNVVLRTPDGAATSGALYDPGDADTAVCVMHPREFMACHYTIPDIAGARCAAWSQSPRSVGSDLRLEHEIALFDVATGLRFLRNHGYKRIVLLGNSGGASLYALYVQQSLLPPAERISRTPAGKKTGLGELDMPLIDGMILLAPHPGQGALLLGCIDPSVTDEHNPLSVDPVLDPFDAANGFAEPPESSSYAPTFVETYRRAQQTRVARLDDIARGILAVRKAAKGGGETAKARKIAGHTPVMTVWRTDADLRCFDLSLDPSERKVGTLWGRNPFQSNFGAVGFARFCTPESWLSTWSALSSNASLAKTAGSLTVPTLVIEYTGDSSTFPSTIKGIVDTVAADDKTHIRVRGDHHGRALTRDEEPGRYVAGREISRWLAERFNL